MRQPTVEQPCLFCLRVGQEPSVEHVIPAAFGRHADAVLPLGAVCRACNNHLGRQVDEALVHLFEVQFIRGLYRIPDADGRRIRQIPVRDGRLEFPDDGEPAVQVTVFRDAALEEKDARTIAVSMALQRRRLGDQWRRAVRAVLKLGLCLLHYGKGAEAALSSEWNPVRRAVYGEPYTGYVLLGPFDVFKPPDLRADVQFDIPGAKTIARLRFGGFEAMTDLGLGPVSEETRAWAVEQGFRVMEIAPVGT